MFSWETLQQQPKLFKILFQGVLIIQRVRTVQAGSKIISISLCQQNEMYKEYTHFKYDIFMKVMHCHDQNINK